MHAASTSAAFIGRRGLTLVVAALSSATAVPASAGEVKPMQVKTAYFGNLQVSDGAVLLLDGGTHGVQGHTLAVSADGAAEWTRRVESLSPSGKPGTGRLQLSGPEQKQLAAWADAAWRLAEKTGKASFSSDLRSGPPRRVWAIVLRRGAELRTVDGGDVGETVAPPALRPALAWLVARVDAAAKE